LARILIVDDHETVRRGLRSLLAATAQWEVCGEAADGLAGVEQAKALRPEIVLMDVSMPGMDGLEATRIIRRELPASKVIIISQNDPDIARRQAREVDASAHVAKNALATELLSTIEAVVGSRRKPKPTPGATTFSQASSLWWLSGGGELGRLIHDHDWTKTPLGRIETWPQSLKASVNLILNARHPMWVGWGKDATFFYNDAYIEVLSRAKHPWALGKPAAEVWSEIWDICGPLADQVFQEGQASFVDEVRLFMNRGDFLEETYYSFSYSPIRDESDQVVGLFCPSTEVTAKVINARRLHTLSELSANALTQKTIQAACASAMATLATNPDDIPFALLYLIDPDGRTANLEQTCCIQKGIAGLTPEAINLEKEESAAALWPLSAVVRSAKSQTVSLKGVAGLPVGAAQQCLSEAVVLPVTFRGDDRPVAVLVAGVNPTRRLDSEYQTFYELAAGQIATAIQNAGAAEEENRRMNALAELDRAKTAFFSNVSHEFRTPLTLMLGPVEELLARSHTDLPPAAKAQLELVNRNGSRLLRLVNTLLDFSRIEAGRMRAVYEPTDLAAFTIELASVFRSATEKAGLQLELDCSPLPEPVFIDRNMWEKIVLNLISNAFKFTFDGSISISLVARGENVELRVRDTGVGIAEAELPRLFDRFHRVENTRSRTHEGSGIGLALVLELVKLHGGSVRVESELEKGSTFIVSVPMGSAHLPADRIGGGRNLSTTALGATPFVEEALRWIPDSEVELADEPILLENELIPVPCPPIPGSHSEKRPIILIADDNADMRQYLSRLLGERYEVITAPDGEAAFAAVLSRQPELVLTDVMMPNLDGFGLLRALRSDAKTRTIPIILLSARAGEEARVEGMEQGADDYLIKPFSARELLARVQTHLEMARIRKRSEEALARRTAQFETLLNEAPLGVYLIDADFRIRALNPPAAKALGDPEELLGQDFDEVIHSLRPKTYADEIIRQFRHTLSTGEPCYTPEGPSDHGKRGAGEVYEWQINRILLPDGRYGVVCYFRDISRQLQARERERRITAEAIAANAKFRAVFEQTTVFAGITTKEGTVIEANKMCLDACGYRAEQVLKLPLWETPWWQKFPESRHKIQAAIPPAAKGIPYREMLHYSWADGTERLVDFALYPIVDERGEILFLHPTGVDITDFKRTEENYRNLAETLEHEVRARTQELEKQNAEVLRQSELVRDFSQRLMKAQDEERRRIARELHDSSGQTLAALGMGLSMLSVRLKDQVLQQDFAALVKQAEESEQLVQQLSREIRTTSYLLHPPLLDEIGLSEALRWYVDGLAGRSGLEIQLNISEGFGRLSRELELVMFRLVQECLTNIHRHSGSKTANIRMLRDDKQLFLEIEDSGTGIAAEKLAHLQSQASGVGIRGMNERVHQFGGQMNIHSNSQGTKISFVFPVRRNSHETESAAEELSKTG
jgi:PAS domain S-box-containing protein